MNKLLVVIVALLLISAGVYWAVQYSSNYGGSNGDISGLLVGDNAIYVADQRPGPSVNISFVKLAKNGFVAIHASADGRPGAIVGSSDFLEAGETRNFAISLSRLVTEGEELFAMPHVDDGDLVFNPANDPPALDSENNVMFMRFFISGGAEDPGAVSL